jgi:hypothetical protein
MRHAQNTITTTTTTTSGLSLISSCTSSSASPAPPGPPVLPVPIITASHSLPRSGVIMRHRKQASRATLVVLPPTLSCHLHRRVVLRRSEVPAFQYLPCLQNIFTNARSDASYYSRQDKAPVSQLSEKTNPLLRPLAFAQLSDKHNAPVISRSRRYSCQAARLTRWLLTYLVS